MKDPDMRGASSKLTAALAGLVWLGACNGGISLGVSADEGGRVEAGSPETSIDGTLEGATAEGAPDALFDALFEDGPSDAVLSEEGVVAFSDGGDASDGMDASVADVDGSRSFDGGDTGADVAAPCGDVLENCCEAGVCNGSSLACNLGTCVQTGVGQQGMRCASTSVCSSGLCLPIGGGQSACTVSCATSADCLAGWACNAIGGQTAKACQCTASAETCDGKDNDCNGIIDDVAGADPWCAAYVGTGYVCRNGSCICGYVCGVSCVTIDDDLANCGGCGNTCPTGQACRAGKCDSKVAAALGGGCVILSDTSVECWGDNTRGQLGNGTTTPAAIPVPVSNLTGVTAVASTYFHQCALLSSGIVECWGQNNNGDLGNGSTTDSPIPVAVSGLTGVAAVAAGQDNVCAVLSGGTVECWGGNNAIVGYPQSPQSTPVAVSGLMGAVAVGVSVEHACALLRNGTVACWGLNTSDGALGVGDSPPAPSYSLTPVAVPGLTGVVAITVGYRHTCARLSNSTVECWGDNSAGQLGDGTTTNHSTPVSVPSLTGVVAISANDSYRTCALLSDATVKCWGGVNATPSTPTAVSGLTGVLAISVAKYVTCALLAGGTVKCWGDALPMGNGMTGASSAPIPLLL